MGNCTKTLIMAVSSLTVAVLIYPMTHEMGHALATLMVGGKIVEFHLLPLPYVLSDISGVSKAGVVLIGLSGIILPLFISAVMRVRRFIAWYNVLIYKGIVLLSFITSETALVLYNAGIKDSNDDAVKVIEYWRGGETLLLMLFAIIIGIVVLSLITERPIERIRSNIGI